MACQNEPRGEAVAPEAWRGRLTDLLHDCTASAPGEQGERLLEAYALFADGAPAAVSVLAAVPEPRGFGHLLACGAWESAALALVNPQCAFMLSRAGSGAALATMTVPGQGTESTVEASTPALALLSAQLAGLIELIEDNGCGARTPAAPRHASRSH